MFDTCPCKDCGIDTCSKAVDEFYMVKNAVWEAATGEPGGSWEPWHDKLTEQELDRLVDRMLKENTERYFLCVGCIEQRLGRRLTPDDFTGALCNSGYGSQRLRERRGQ